MLIQNSLEDYLSKLASDAHAPGGGSASALVGATGVALIEMAIRLTIDKPQAEEKLLKQKLSILEEKRVELLQLVDKDATAFSKLMQAYQLPKSNSEQKDVRAAAIQRAVKDTASVPLQVVKANVEALDIAESLCGKINPNLVSDLKIGIMHCYTSFEGSLINVAINVPLMKDQELKNYFESEVQRLKIETKNKYESIISAIQI